MKILVTRRAAQRLRDIAAYVRLRNPAAALQVEQAIQETFNLIAEHPQVGRILTPKLRRLPVSGLPYLVFYSIRVSKGHIEIITVNHAARSKQP